MQMVGFNAYDDSAIYFMGVIDILTSFKLIFLIDYFIFYAFLNK